MKYLLIGFLKVYRLLISPLYGDVCRYYPSCSAYALDAVRHHGAVRGSWFAVRRLLRCHPWAPGGYDPVPGTEPDQQNDQERDAAVQGTLRVGHPGDGRSGGVRLAAGRTEQPHSPTADSAVTAREQDAA